MLGSRIVFICLSIVLKPFGMISLLQVHLWPPSRSFTVFCAPLFHTGCQAVLLLADSGVRHGASGSVPPPRRASERTGSLRRTPVLSHVPRALSRPQEPPSTAPCSSSSVFLAGPSHQAYQGPKSQGLPPPWAARGSRPRGPHTGTQAAGQAAVCSHAGHHARTVHHAWALGTSPKVARITHSQGHIKSTAVPNSRGMGCRRTASWGEAGPASDGAPPPLWPGPRAGPRSVVGASPHISVPDATQHPCPWQS